MAQPACEPPQAPATQPLANKPSIVKLNVGGSRYTVGLATLTCAESSYFDILFSGRWSSQLTEDGEVFIDRDGEVRDFCRTCGSGLGGVYSRA